MNQTHWAERSRHWSRSTPPLRYDAVALQTLKDLIGIRTDRILLLGVTTELTNAFPNIVAVEREPKMIENVWLGNTATKTVIQGDWLTIDLDINSFSAAVGDGSINQVAFPHEQKNLLTKIHSWLQPGGVFACRMYTRPDQPVTRADLIREGITPSVNWAAYRRMLSMHLAERRGQTIETRLITELFNDLFPERDLLPWTQEQLEMIDTYATSGMRSCLPTRSELKQIAPDGVELLFIDTGDYDLAEYCPIMTFTKPQ